MSRMPVREGSGCSADRAARAPANDLGGLVGPAERVYPSAVNRAVCLLAAALSSEGCAAFLANTDVALLSLRAVDARAGTGAIEVSYQVVSHNTGPDRIVGMLYEVWIPSGGDWVSVGEGYDVKEVDLTKDVAVTVSSRLPIDMAAWPDVSAAVARGDIRIDGELRVEGGLGLVQVPFAFMGGEGPANAMETDGPEASVLQWPRRF